MRLTFEISNEDGKILHDNIPYGQRKHFYAALISGLVSKLQEDRMGTLVTIISHQWDLPELLERAREDERFGNKQAQHTPDDDGDFN
jgi:hypothetical protein